MKILVTGAAGFVGGYLIRELNDHGHTAVGTDIQNADYITDLLDKSSVAEVLKNTMPDAVIHLACLLYTSGYACYDEKDS